MLLAEETKNRIRIDRGRMLVLIPHDYVCPQKIRVEEGPSLSKVRNDKFCPDLEVNALEEGMENAQNEMEISKGTTGSGSSYKGNGGGVNVRKECGKSFSKLSKDNKVDKVGECSNPDKYMFVSSGTAKHMGERSNKLIENDKENDKGTRQHMGERRSDHLGEGTENDILKLTKASSGIENDILMSSLASGCVVSKVGYVGKPKNREQREKCDWVGKSDLSSSDSFESVSSLRSVKSFWFERWILWRSHFVNLEEGTAGQFPTGHRNGTNTEVSGHKQRGSLNNSSVEVQSPWLMSLTNAIWPVFGVRTRPNFYAANLFLLQYFLPVIMLYIMFTRATKTCAALARATWTKAAFNLLLYIHGGHVFGALWYVFAIEKEIDCWKKAGRPYTECPRDCDFECDLNSQDYKFINEFCPTKTRNTTAYDFGIYHDALESGIVGMRNFPRRVLHCFRWGLQSLSGFGQNINQASTDAWENIFVISITIYGMVLFVFFIGNMQIYLQSQTNKSEMIRQKKQEIEQSKSFEKLPRNLKKQIKKYQPEKWQETKGGVDFGNLFSNLPDDLKRNIQRELSLELLKKVAEFRSWSEELLDELCDCAKPVSYDEHVEIVRRGSSVDEMLFLVQGKLRTYSLTRVDTSSAASPPRFETSINHLEDGEFCGEELVAWFQADLYSSNLPISTRTIQTIKKVDAFSLMSYDLQNVFITHRTALSTSTQVKIPLA
ncbi:hypothetical protein Ddye_014048 [Dipteronia dyeriana]|uniref:Cyclic nucleotide-binding domain-containing protein n=1 Tax=Dipteronia dyeriana TaxID=168575 RepID=A0AAE0CK77_9ROSI|nr:hypothetical protein Ddye_014048 [Dipteronia dyeriana]